VRPPILFLVTAFGVGLWVGLDLFRETGEGRGETWLAGLVVLAALGLAKRAPLGAAIGIMLGCPRAGDYVRGTVDCRGGPVNGR